MFSFLVFCIRTLLVGFFVSFILSAFAPSVCFSSMSGKAQEAKRRRGGMTANSHTLYIFYMLSVNPHVNILPRTVRVLPPGGGRKGGVAASAVSREWTRFVSKTLKKISKTLIAVAHTHGMMMKYCRALRSDHAQFARGLKLIIICCALNLHPPGSITSATSNRKT